MTSPKVQAIVILDGSDGSRLHAKYYTNSLGGFDAQRVLEKKLYNKTKGIASSRTNYEILLVDKSIVVYRQTADSAFFVLGGLQENELILLEVLKGLYESLGAILRQHLDKKSLLMSLDVILLAVDEIIDGGLILETDPLAISNRVLMRNAEPVETNIGEMTVSEALNQAKNSFFKSFLN